MSAAAATSGVSGNVVRRQEFPEKRAASSIRTSFFRCARPPERQSRRSGKTGLTPLTQGSQIARVAAMHPLAIRDPQPGRRTSISSGTLRQTASKGTARAARHQQMQYSERT